MTKTIVTIVASILVLAVCSYGEYREVHDTFDTFYSYLEQTEIKLKDNNVSVEDTKALRNFWLEKKKSLHVWVPHADIKEIDLWLSEAVTFVDEKDYKEALSKLEVLIELTEQIPKTFAISFENIL